jgi:hypothetical protein
VPGPVPKDPTARRRRNEPARGEWVDLEPLDGPVLPVLPKLPRNAKWPERVVAAWSAWQEDPATGQYGPAEISAAVELAFVMRDYVRGDEKAAEVRLRMDALGLSSKGKRDLRWRAPSEKVAAPRKPQLAEVRRLRAVDPAG